MSNRQSTGIFGVAANPMARNQLKLLYSEILSEVQQMSDSGYRQCVIQLASERLDILNSSHDDVQVEQKIGMGQLEELVEQAQDEKNLIQYIKTNSAQR